MKITYLEVYVNGTLHKRHDITNENGKIVEAYIDNIKDIKTVSFNELVTDRPLQVGKINSLT
jgi:hypothetical protein